MGKKILRELAWARSGDKGDISDLGIMAKDDKIYDILKKEITPKKLKEFYKDSVKGEIEVFPMDNLKAIKVVMKQALSGGATKSLRWDMTGKAMATSILRMEIDVG